MHELDVERVGKQHYLNLVIWEDESGFIHTVWPVTKLYGSEADFLNGNRGGRFRTHDRSVKTNCISLQLGRAFEDSQFGTVLTWIAENVDSGWSFEFLPAEPVEIGGNFGLATTQSEMKFYFEEADVAVLCKLKFA